MVGTVPKLISVQHNLRVQIMQRQLDVVNIPYARYIWAAP